MGTDGYNYDRKVDKSGRITAHLPTNKENAFWLDKEKERIEKASGDTCEIINNPFDGTFALYYKHVYYHDGVKYQK